jgi:predicted DNA-binding transcriptional regulator AlpA
MTPKQAAAVEFFSDKQAAEFLGVGERTFADLIGQPWMPAPIILGPRLRRWSRAELVKALTERAPRSDGKQPEPKQLARSRGR